MLSCKKGSKYEHYGNEYEHVCYILSRGIRLASLGIVSLLLVTQLALVMTNINSRSLTKAKTFSLIDV